MGVNGREYDRSGGVRAMPSPKGGLQTPKGATHTGGGGLVYGDGSWDLTVFVTDLQEFFRKQKYFLTRSSAILTLVCFYNGTQKNCRIGKRYLSNRAFDILYYTLTDSLEINFFGELQNHQSE